MKTLLSSALRFESDTLSVLDQRKLPNEVVWVVCHSPEEMVRLIKTLAVRGAPLIGVAAALSLAHFAERGASDAALAAAAKDLIASRPTAVNLAHCVLRLWQPYEATQDRAALIACAEQLFEEDAQLSENIANQGAGLIQSGESLLTHCNSGGLVTTGVGTALGAILRAHQQGKRIHVYVDETRPLLQGARLTAYELQKAGVPHTLICDGMAAMLMQSRKIHRVIVGADRIAANGDTANKIGTYSVAVLAHFHRIPFHFAAPYTTFDWMCEKGSDIHIEAREGSEVQGFADIRWTLPETPTFNPAFDVTPHQLVTSYITERGVFECVETLKERGVARCSF